MSFVSPSPLVKALRLVAPALFLAMGGAGCAPTTFEQGIFEPIPGGVLSQSGGTSLPSGPAAAEDIEAGPSSTETPSEEPDAQARALATLAAEPGAVAQSNQPQATGAPIASDSLSIVTPTERAVAPTAASETAVPRPVPVIIPEERREELRLSERNLPLSVDLLEAASVAETAQVDQRDGIQLDTPAGTTPPGGLALPGSAPANVCTEAGVLVSSPLHTISLESVAPDATPPSALVRLADGQDRTVRIGSLLGDGGARVVHIATDRILLSEIAIDASGRPYMSQSALRLPVGTR